MWCLLQLLPLLIGNLIPKDCKYWLNFLKLLKIIDIIFAPETTNLAELIEDRHTTFHTTIFMTYHSQVSPHVAYGTMDQAVSNIIKLCNHITMVTYSYIA